MAKIRASRLITCDTRMATTSNELLRGSGRQATAIQRTGGRRSFVWLRSTADSSG